MSRSLFWRISAPLTVLVVTIMVVFGYFNVNMLRREQTSQLRAHLVNEARLVAIGAAPLFSGAANEERLDDLARTAGIETGVRITVIALDGTVLGDTLEDPESLENHASRPEVSAALSGRMGETVRYSTTLGEPAMYVAVPVTDGGSVVGVARVSMPLATIESSLRDSVITSIWSTALATALVVIGAAVIARAITIPVSKLTVASGQIASGDLGQQIVVKTHDEIGRLGRTFNEMSSSLKETVMTLSDERNRLVTVMDSMPSGIVMTDSRKKVLLANPASALLYGFDGRNVAGRSLIEVVHDHEVDTLVDECLRTGETRSAQIESLAGRYLRAIVVPLAPDRPSGALLILQDLTELRSLQLMRQQFLGDVSHELRTPLTAIRAIVETLRDGAIDDRPLAVEFLSKVESEVDGMAQMVSELIELSRVETGRADLDLRPGDLNQTVREVVARFLPQAERGGISLSADLAAFMPPVTMDADRVRQVVANILHNAIKFTGHGGNVTVRTRSEVEAVTVAVEDTGTGIPKDDLPHVFERFFKGDRSRSRGGSGLGLAIAKHIVLAHQGAIWVDSQEGKGSVFTFRLPAKPPA